MLVYLVEEKLETQAYVCDGILIATSVYLLFIEATSILRRQIHYFKSIQRVINLITPMLIIDQVISQSKDEETAYYFTVQTWCALAVWFRGTERLLYYKKFSWLVYCINLCFRKISIFIVVLAISILAFADAFSSIQ